MIKGAQKRMIVVKTSDSSIFEEAYFVLRKDSLGGGEDMVAEANRIIEDNGGRGKKKESGMRSVILSVVCFAAGGAFGGAVACLLCILV